MSNVLMKRIDDVLNDKEKNYIFPFLWTQGENEEKMKEYIEEIYNSGVKSICVESRPHPDYLGEKWWSDLIFIMKESKKRNMKVWILDDEHFPTGSVKGIVKKKYRFNNINVKPMLKVVIAL